MTGQRIAHGFVFLGFAAIVIWRAVTSRPAGWSDGVLLLIAIGLANRLSRSHSRSVLVTIPLLLFGWYQSAPISAAVMVALLLVFRAKASEPPLLGFVRTRAMALQAFHMLVGAIILLLSPVFVVLGLPALMIKWARDRRSDRLRFERQLQHPDKTKRAEALTALANLCDPKAAPTFIKLLEHPDWYVRMQASDALLALRVDGVTQLLSALTGASPEGAARLWHVLGSARDERALLPAFRAMEQAPPEVRSAAAAALEMIVSAEKVDSDRVRLKDLDPLAPRLLAWLHDLTPEVRRASAVVLGRLEYEPAAGPLTTVLNDEEEDVDIRGEAALALGRMGAEHAVADLVGWLRAESLSDYVPRALHLMNRGVPELLSQFEQAPAGTDEYGLSRRGPWLWAMYWFAHPDTLDTLIAVAVSPLPEERRLAADGIGNVILQAVARDRRLRGVDPDDAAHVVSEEVAALVTHGRPVLARLSTDPAEEVASAARKNLEWIDRRVA